MSELRLLIWLKARHMRSAAAWWGYMFGADIEQKPDLIDKLYYLYLAALLAVWTGSVWAFARASVAEGFAAAGAPLAALACAALLMAPVIVMLCTTLSALRRPPVRLTAADTSYLVSSGLPMRWIALVDVLPRVVAASVLAFAAAYLLCTGCAAALPGFAVLPCAAACALGVGAARVYAQLIGCLHAVLPDRLAVRILVAAGSLACAVSLGIGAMHAVRVLGFEALLALATSCGTMTTVAVLAAVILAGMMAGMVAVADRMDCIRVIEMSGAYAALFGVRRLALQAPDVYRELQRRYRIAHRRFRPTIPVAAGAAAPVCRAALSHLRQYESLLRLAGVGAIVLLVSAWVLTSQLPPAMLVVWGYGVLMFANATRELSLAFRDDMRVLLVRDHLPFSHLRLALLDSVPALAFVLAISFAVIAAAGWLMPGFASPAVFGVSALFGIGLSLSAALDGVEVRFARTKVTSLSGLLALLLSSALCSMLGAIGAAYALFLVDGLLLIALSNGR